MSKRHWHARTRAKDRPSRRRSGERRASSPLPSESPPAAGLVDTEHRRFPWPANPDQRYGLEAPYLAVVNARGPWGVWKHRTANPPFIPLCLDLLDKAFWRSADHGQRVFCLTVWLQAAREDDWGIVWGDPVRLCLDWRLDPATFTSRLEWMIGHGLACYLTRAEADAARTWRNHRSKIIDQRSEGEGGKPEGGGGESGRGEGEDKQDKTSKTRQGKQISDALSHTKNQISRLGIEHSQGQASQASQASKPSKSQGQGQGTAQGQEAGNLPKSDRRAVADRSEPLEPPGGHPRNARPGSVSLGDAIAWTNTRAVLFGRALYEAIHGRPAPPDLAAAHERDRGDVGVWVHYWQQTVADSIPAGRYDEFEKRCVADIRKKRKVRSIRNLGAVAMAKIVPGILDAMTAK